jgi:hypothetical protein
VATVILGALTLFCDLALTGDLADALAGQPASLGDAGAAFSIALLVAGFLLIIGGITSLILIPRSVSTVGSSTTE